LAFERVFNKPKRGLGDATLKTIRKVAMDNQTSVYQAAKELLETDDLKKRAKNSLASVVALFEKWIAEEKELPPAQLAKNILEESGYIDMWKADKGADSDGRIENLQELINVIEGGFSNIAEFLEHVSLVIDNDEKADEERATLMTLHAAKGLEFDVVFLPGWEEGLFPHNRSIDEGGNAAIEEERRLAHVGITRARRRAYITLASNRMIYGNWQNNIPSRFIDEMPRENVEVSGGGKLYNQNDNQLDLQEKSGTWSWSGNHGYSKKKSSSWSNSSYKTNKTDFNVKDKIVHGKFGCGFIKAIDGQKLEIVFENGDRKKIMASFVTKL
jgi:DNA helicase-2/ATP-dependent DNA helicase PcrA